jgi:hypothetical protein
VQHEVFAVFAFERIDDLLVLAVPSVATTSACVSPRVNRAEPWARGSSRPRLRSGRTVLVSRPSMRTPSRRIAPRTISFSMSLNIFNARAVGFILEQSGGVGLAASSRSVRVLLAAFAVGGLDLRTDRFAQFASIVALLADGSAKLHGSLAQVSASSMIASITG